MAWPAGTLCQDSRQCRTLLRDVMPSLCPMVRLGEGPAEHGGRHCDAKLATGGHGVACVRGEIEQDLIDLDPVRENAWRLGVCLKPRVGAPDLAAVGLGKSEVRQKIRLGIEKQSGDGWEAHLQSGDDLTELLAGGAF